MAWMLGARTQRWLKGLHVLSAAVCLGGVAALLVLLPSAGVPGGSALSPGMDLAAHRLLNRAVTPSFYAVLATGLLFSLFTGWGFARQRWVPVKWAGAFLAFAVTAVWLAPAAAGMAGLADGRFSVDGTRALYGRLFRQALFSAGALGGILAVLFFVSVLKPWGKVAREFRVRPAAVRWMAGVLSLAVAALMAAGSVSLHRIRSTQIGHVDPGGLADGVYEGVATDGSFSYLVRVAVADGRIGRIEAARNRDSLYARIAEGVFARIVERQSPRVDAITGATTTSVVLQKAVERALSGERNR